MDEKVFADIARQRFQDLKQHEARQLPERSRAETAREYFQRPQNTTERGAGDWSGSSWGGERMAGRSWGGGRER
jgi:hypothetical protein